MDELDEETFKLKVRLEDIHDDMTQVCRTIATLAPLSHSQLQFSASRLRRILEAL